jgi:hypothetical protein
MVPQSIARGIPKRDRAAAGVLQPCHSIVGYRIPLRGRIFLREETSLPYAVAPSALSPFAHPIPQSRHGARGDLFRAYLNHNRCAVCC